LAIAWRYHVVFVTTLPSPLIIAEVLEADGRAFESPVWFLPLAALLLATILGFTL